jgi:hypothetical protein
MATLDFDDLIPKRKIESGAPGLTFDDLVPGRTSDLDGSIPAPKAKAPDPKADRPGWVAWAKSLVTGEGRTEFPDAPELNAGQAGNITLEDAQAGKAPDYDPAVISRSAITSDPAAQLDILRKQVPGIQTKQDKHGNAMVMLPGQTEWAYLNKPGASWRDLDEVGTQTLATLPLLGSAGAGSTLGTRILTALGLGAASSVANDAIAVSEGSEQGIDKTKAALAGGITAGLAPGVPTAIVGGARDLALGGARAVRNQAERVYNPSRAADRAVADAQRADFDGQIASGKPMLTPAEVERLEQWGLDFRVMDTGGEAMSGLARSAANQSPEARRVINDAVQPRYEQQAQRGINMMRDQVDSPALAHLTREQLQAEGDKARAIPYARSYREGDEGILDDQILGLTEAPAMRRAMGDANTSVENRRAGGIAHGRTEPVNRDDLPEMAERVPSQAPRVGEFRLYRVDGDFGAGTTYVMGAEEAARRAEGIQGGRVMYVDVPPSQQGALRNLSGDNFGVPDAVAQTAKPFRSGQGRPTRDTEDVNAIIDMWTFTNAQRQQPKPETLTSFLARNRGVVDDGGDLAKIEDKATRPGLQRRDTRGPADQENMFGRPEIDNDLDSAAQRAWEAGFFPEHQTRPTKQDLLDALDDEARGNVRYRPEDEEAAAAFRDAHDMENMLADEGIVGARSWTPEKIREHLNDASLPGAQGKLPPTLEYWDLVKRKLDEQINDAVKNKEASKVRDLTVIRDKLVARLDAAVPTYQEARGVAETFFKANNALEAGEKFVTMSLRGGDENTIQQALDKMTKRERDLFAEGFASKYVDLLNSTADRTNLLNQIATSAAARRRIEMALGPGGARDVELFVRGENILDNIRKGMGNSTTARQLVELGLVGGAGAIGGGGNPLDPHGLMYAAIMLGATRGRAKVQSNVAMEVAKRLVSNDPVQLKRGFIDKETGPILEAIRAADNFIAGMPGIRNVAAQQGAQ